MPRVRPALGPGAGRHLALCSQWGGQDSAEIRADTQKTQRRLLDG